MSWLLVVVGLLVIGAVCLALVGKIDITKAELPDAEPDLRPVDSSHPDTFDVVVRGYRMDEVDAVINQLQAQIQDLKKADDAPPH